MYKEVDMTSHFKIKSLYSIFKDKNESDYYFGGERHKLWEFVTVTDGKIGVTADNDAFILKAGRGIIHEPWEFHRLWSEGVENEIIVFTFTAENLPSYSSKLFEIKDTGKLINIVDEIRTVFKTEGGHITEPKEGLELKCQIAVKKLEIFLLETLSENSATFEIKRTKAEKNYAKIVNILENNLDKNLSIDDIATLCNMSKVNVSKIFSRYSGMGVIAYYNQLKINYAVPMLKSNMSIKQIAEALGFENQNYFCTVFKRIKGKSPSKYI